MQTAMGTFSFTKLQKIYLLDLFVERLSCSKYKSGTVNIVSCHRGFIQNRASGWRMSYFLFSVPNEFELLSSYDCLHKCALHTNFLVTNTN